MKLSKMHVNIVILEVLLIVAGVTAVLLKEVTARLNVNVLPDIKAFAPEITVKDLTLPEQRRIHEISSDQKAKAAPKPQEITINLDGAPAPAITPSSPASRPRRVAPREEKPATEEFTFELE